jgi:hypothetical protein
MVDTCANPVCAIPLKYLRDGRIYIFEAGSLESDPGEKRMRHLEHFWLCGACCASLILTHDGKGIRVSPKPASVPEEFDSIESAQAPSGWRTALARGA